MPYLVDSDVLIAQREGQPGSLTVLEQLAPEGLAISIITYMEVYQGTLRSSDPESARASLATFLAGVPVVPSPWPPPGAAPRCGRHLAHHGKRVRSRALDLITAAIALEHGYTLVTYNRPNGRVSGATAAVRHDGRSRTARTSATRSSARSDRLLGRVPARAGVLGRPRRSA